MEKTDIAKDASLIPSFLTGVYLGINAISDSYLIVEGTDCVENNKIETICPSHDIYSTLLISGGISRIISTRSSIKEIIYGRNENFIKIFQDLTFYNPGIIFISSLPIYTIIGKDYLKTINAIRKLSYNKIIDVFPNSVNLDYLDGYSLVLEKLALNIEFKKVSNDKKKIGIVGYFFDRNEGEHKGNIKEIKRLLSKLGLEVVSIWLDGNKFEELLKIQEAGIIISLPYARNAAKIIANKIGAQLVETDLPFGFYQTAKWIETIGSACSIDKKKIQKIINNELQYSYEICHIPINSVIAGKLVCFTGDPYIARSFLVFAKEIGMIVRGVFCTTLTLKDTNVPNQNCLYNPIIKFNTSKMEYEKIIENLHNDKECDLLISNSLGLRLKTKNLSILEFGYPSYNTHFLVEKPFLGFTGAINMIERIFNAIHCKEITNFYF
jgi:nitrogenase molybdenum-iron protein beta chain